MIRFLFRFLGLWLLAGAFVALVIDGTRSVSASRLVFAPLRDAWTMFDSAHLAAIEKKFEGSLLEPALTLLLSLPFFAFLALIGLLLLLIGRRKREIRVGYSSRD